MTDVAGWQPDPFGRHEVRYWDGSAWTAHVADAGVQGRDEPVSTVEAPLPPPPAPSPAAPPATGGGWKDRLKQAAQQGKELAEKGKAELAKQQAQRATAAANDPDTLWIGEKKSAGTAAIGVSTTRYRITKTAVFVEAGLMSSMSEQVPLWAVRDIDVRQNVMQRGKDIGDVLVHLEHPEFHGKAELLLDNIEDPYGVRDLLNRQVSEARAKKQMLTQTQYLQHSGQGYGMSPPAAQPPPAAGAAPGVDVADQLRKLAELRDQGILTDEEFAVQKQRLLGL